MTEILDQFDSTRGRAVYGLFGSVRFGKQKFRAQFGPGLANIADLFVSTVKRTQPMSKTTSLNFDTVNFQHINRLLTMSKKLPCFKNETSFEYENLNMSIKSF